MKLRDCTDAETMKAYLNARLREDYISGLGHYFLPDGSPRMLAVEAGGTRLRIPVFFLASYERLAVESIQIKTS